MPEEKKESFTFSDKIRNSKSPASASFANRISSKIGSNGRPKKTLFERTKRDAPFFIAALAALLLLPFLYKYSGQVNEEPVIAPSSEDTVFDPERYGFDTAVTDPDGQIAQLSARDPLSLIKGWGSDTEEPSDVSYDYDRSGLDDSSSSYTSSPTTETTTNIYRRTAAPATRAAVRRSTTKIKEMGRAAMASAGGGLNITPWGGSLKGAAKKVSAPDYKTPPKPVSLQPLQAVGRPQRGYFGMGAGEQARRSAQALTKGNAMQALRDAQYAPINPGRVGGLSSGESRGPGGHSDLKHGFGYNGITPWWWDLMKTRSQMEWEKRFNRKWDWIGWADKLAQNILGGLINCLLTGEDDGAMGEFLGASGEGAQMEGCKCGKSYITNVPGSAPAGLSLKDWCKSKEAKDQFGCEWQNAKATGGSFIQTRLDCLGFGFGRNRRGLGVMADISSANGMGRAACKDFQINKVYSIALKGDASKWNAYHFVVARNNSPFGNGKRLCGFDSSRQYTKSTSTGIDDVIPQVSLDEAYRLLSVAKGQLKQLQNIVKTQPAYKRNRQTAVIDGREFSAEELKAEIDKMEHSLEKARRSGEVTVGNNFAKRSQQSGRVQGRYSYEDINANAGKAGDENTDVEINYHDCVIYLAAGQEFEWRKFKEETMLLLAQMQGSQANTFYELEHDPGYITAYNAAKQAFGRLELRYIRGIVTEKSLAVDGKVSKNDAKLPAMPMIYFDFDRSYIQRTKGRSAGRERDLDKVFDRKERTNYLLTTPCDFTDLAILGEKITDNSPVATLKIPGTMDFKGYEVTAVITYEGEGQNYRVEVPASEIEPVAGTIKKDGANQTQQYRIKDAKKLLMQQHPELVENGKLKPGFDLSGADGKVKANVDWKAIEKASQRTAADEVPVEAEKVEPPAPTPTPVVEVQRGGSLANYSCDPSQYEGAPSTSLVFYNGQTKSVDINTAYKENPIWCRECQDTAKQVLSQVIKTNEDAVQKNEASIEQLKKASVPVSDPKYAELELANKKAKQAISVAKGILDKEKTSEWWLTTMDYLIVLDYMSQDKGDNTVPVRSVCYLARSIAQISADPDVPNNSKFPNTFGTFAVYVGPDSYLFPMQTSKVLNVNGAASAAQKDPRFTGRAPIHWGYYDHSFWDSGEGFNGVDNTYPSGFIGYQDFLASRGIGVNGYYPLAAMQLNYASLNTALNVPNPRGPSYAGSSGNKDYNTWSGGRSNSHKGTRQWRNEYHEQYNRPFYDAGGCQVYSNQSRMSVNDVLAYLNLLCRNGLNFKPQTGYQKMDVDRRGYTGDTKQGVAGQGVVNE